MGIKTNNIIIYKRRLLSKKFTWKPSSYMQRELYGRNKRILSNPIMEMN